VTAKKYLVMNGDSYLGGAWPTHMRSVTENQAFILSRWVADVSRFGALEFERDKLTGFREKSEEGPGWINAGIYLLPGDWLAELMTEGPLSFETDVLPQWLAEEKEIRVSFERGDFLDIGTPETLRMANDFFENQLQKINISAKV